MIPKIIHYCWFGGNPLSPDAVKCIESWRRYFPDYEVKEWNESNFDVRMIPYTADAYEAGKYAFVSDFARMWILYNHGGLYFDTDVEVIRPFDDILARGSFMGCEIDGGNPYIMVNPGLGLGTESGNPVMKHVVDFYSKHNFRMSDGSINPEAIVRITTNALVAYGLKDEPGIQTVEGITIYPKEYFNPFDDNTGRLNKTSNTYSIHWYSKTWMTVNPIRQKLVRLIHRFISPAVVAKIKKFIR